MATSTHEGQGMKSTVLKIWKLDGPETEKVKHKQKIALQQNSALSEQLRKQQLTAVVTENLTGGKAINFEENHTQLREH